MTAAQRPPWPVLHACWLAIMLAAALLLRSANLHHPVLFIDEAESAINAMTILQHGVPTDEYLGLPLFENTLVQPWPAQPEYAFRDVSYSGRGLAIYHGWLPLYAIAASYRLSGIAPDAATDPPIVQTDEGSKRLRTLAARAPAVAFGMLFVIATALAARRMAGADAALIAVTLAALAPPAVRVARQARYYAPAQLLGLLCCLAIYLMWRDGRRRHFLLGALAFALLFHTHVLTFAIACAILAGLVPFMRHHDRIWMKLGSFAGVVLLATVPWILFTGFPGQAGLIPAARTLLAPEDWTLYLVRHWKVAVLLVGGALWLGLALALVRGQTGAGVTEGRVAQTAVALRSGHWLVRLAEPFAAHRHALLLLLGWILAGYVGFLLLVPASSAFLWRLTLGVQGPGLLFVGIMTAAGVHGLMAIRREPHPLPPAGTGPTGAGALVAICLGFAMLALPAVRRPLEPPPPWRAAEYEALEYLAAQDLPPGTRIYATPLHHLTLTLLGGIPVQSTAPVRKEWFDSYPGNIIILETVVRARHLDPTDLHAAARAAGVELSDEQIPPLQQRLGTWLLRQELAERGMMPDRWPDPLEPWQMALLEAIALEPIQDDPDGLWDNPAMFRGYQTPDKWGFWQTFFYRFVDPGARSGSNLNYADRVRGARAVVLDSSWVVIHAPEPKPMPGEPEKP